MANTRRKPTKPLEILIEGEDGRKDAERLERALTLYLTFQENKLRQSVNNADAMEQAHEIGELDRLRKQLRQDLADEELQDQLQPRH